MDKTAAPLWFAMRVTYKRELLAKEELEKAGIETFIPMRAVWDKAGRRKVRRMEPVIHNLLFVRTDKNTIQEFKTSFPYLQYMVRREAGKSAPIVVPDRQMADFISLCDNYEDCIEFIDPAMADLKTGVRVRVVNGDFTGYEGVLVRIEGKARRKVVVEVEGLVMVALATVPVKWVEVLE